MRNRKHANTFKIHNRGRNGGTVKSLRISNNPSLLFPLSTPKENKNKIKLVYPKKTDTIKFPTPDHDDIFQQVDQQNENINMLNEDKQMKKLQMNEAIKEYTQDNMEPFECNGPNCALMGGKKTRKHNKRNYNKQNYNKRIYNKRKNKRSYRLR